jgi:wyosine [tRNA(Phe)-imidazoG37] synthetase (radical SAM superfamily)
MRPDPSACRDPDLLAAEVRRLQAVIDNGEPTLTDAEREAIAWFAEAGKPLALLTRSHNREQYRATLRGLLERTK